MSFWIDRVLKKPINHGAIKNKFLIISILQKSIRLVKLLFDTVIDLYDDNIFKDRKLKKGT